MTITGANVLTAWRHDVGGFYQSDNNHMNPNKQRDPELLLRWLQFAVFSPIVAPHCNHCEIRAWKYPNFPLLQTYFQLRNSLLPYLYSAAFEASKTAVLPVHGLYIDYPHEPDAYVFTEWDSNVSTVAPCPHVPQFAPCAVTRTQQYAFGKAFVVAPIFEPACNQTAGTCDKLVTKELWIPPGKWVRWQAPSGKSLQGPKRLTAQFSNAEMAVLAKEGAVVAMKGYEAMHDVAPSTLTLQVVLSPVGEKSAGSTSVYEDDGTTLQYIENAAFRLIKISQTSNETTTTLIIVPHSGGSGYRNEREMRSYELQLLCGGQLELTSVMVMVDGAATLPSLITTRSFGPNSISTPIVKTEMLDASAPVTIVARYARIGHDLDI